MKAYFIKRFISIYLVVAMVFPALLGNIFTKTTASAAVASYHFDFGGGGTASGYIGVSASTAYSPSLGYGFANPSKVKNVSASGSGALSDAVQFTDTSYSNTFNVDLPNGLYRVTVTLGDTIRTSIAAEGVLQIINMTGNNARDTILIPITDGQLNIMATDGKAGYAHTMSALDIEWVSSDTQLPPTIWFCGDSTVCNYYPKDTSVQAGWGQVFDQYIDTSKWQVRNLAASGQYAAGFVSAGQFEPILKYGKKGDIYIISIGINDTNYSNKDEYTQVVTNMVQKAKAKGMKVILVKQQGRAGDVTNNPNLTGRWFSSQLDAIGSAENVQVIDLFVPFLNYCKLIGQEATNNLYMSGDTLHPNRQGAMKLAEIAASQIVWDNTDDKETGSEISEDITFMLKNVNSGLYLSLADNAADGTNVVQAQPTGINAGLSLWRAESAGDGYYRIYSCAGNGSYLLDVAYASAENGVNVGIWSDTACDAQLFKFIKQENGGYIIATKTTNDASAVEVVSADTTSGANVQQWERNGHACQTWVLEKTVRASDNAALGDLNGDGAVNAMDLAILKRVLINSNITRKQSRSADINMDTSITAADCRALSDFLIKRNNIEAVETDNRVYYAVDQAYNSGVEESINAGFVSDAYLNLDNRIGSFIEWHVNVPSDGNYLCTFRIANGSANDRRMKIEVNNDADYWIQPFLPTTAWTKWEERGIVLPLKSGENIIRMTSLIAEGGPNIDYLMLERTDEPIAEAYALEENPPVTGDGDVTIYIAGDSTVQTYRESYAPQQGWGAFLGDYFKDSVMFSNHAIAGRSSKSFYDNGRLDTILNQIQAGDYLLVQFGINDAAYNNAERYAPTCGTVPGTEGSFEFYMAKYIEGALSKGATPILITPTLSLKNYSNGTFVSSYSNYTDSVKKLAVYYKVPYIDLNDLMVKHYNSIGYDKAYSYYMCSTGSSDMTHFTETGAKAVAGLVANAIKGLGIDILGNVIP